jgi:GT2 family glycosyltransferase
VRPTEIVERMAPQARLVRDSANSGFAGACNEAAALATGDLLVYGDGRSLGDFR